MRYIALRVPTQGDVEAISSVVDAQDTSWWGEPDGDIDDVRHELERVQRAMGSLGVGARVAVIGAEIVGVALMVGHGHTSVAVDPNGIEASSVRLALFGWLAGFGDVQIEAPTQDADRLAERASLGFVPHRSSFELERPGAVDDLPEPSWPDGVRPEPKLIGLDVEAENANALGLYRSVGMNIVREWLHCERR